MRACTKCKEVKPFSEFNKRSKSASGYREKCKICTRAQNQAWKMLNKPKMKEDNAKWYKANADKLKRKHSLYWLTFSEKAKHKKLLQNHKISFEHYNTLLIKQNMSCAICERHQSMYKRQLAVDHDHETGEIRGLLCHCCNTGIGSLRDDYLLVDKASQYLKRSKIKLVENIR